MIINRSPPYLAIALLLAAYAGPRSSQAYRPGSHAAGLCYSPAGTPDRVLVLGTPHLSHVPGTLDPEAVVPLVDRLVKGNPNAIAVEVIAGLVCDAMRPNRARTDADTIEACCHDPAHANTVAGLTPYGMLVPLT